MLSLARALVVAVCLIGSVLPMPRALAQVRELRDDFSDTAPWRTITTEGVTATLTPERRNGRAVLRVDYRFGLGSGYAILQRDWASDLPPNYELSFGLEGDGRTQTLEVKLLDAAGESVWWVNRRDFAFAPERRVVRNLRRQFEFAWGPLAGQPLPALGKIEIVITSATGGSGTVYLDDLRLVGLPVVEPYAARPTATAARSVEHEFVAAPQVTDGDASTVHTEPSGEAVYVVDWNQAREWGGVAVDWSGRTPQQCVVEASVNGRDWFYLGVMEAPAWSALPARTYLPTPDVQARHLRLSVIAADPQGNAPRPAVGLAEVHVLPVGFGASMTGAWRHIAQERPGAGLPAYFSGRQSFWTVVGVPTDQDEALINEQGLVEVDRLGPSLEPAVMVGGQLLTWEQASCTPTLFSPVAPLPVVTRAWDKAGLELTIRPLAQGEPGASRLIVRYELKNTGDQPASGEMRLALRPLQVNPTWQFLNTVGGAGPVRSVQVERGTGAGGAHVDLVVNGDKRLSFLPRPDAPRLASFVCGDALLTDTRATSPRVDCAYEGASAVVPWAFRLAPGQQAAFMVVAPFHGTERPADLPGDDALAQTTWWVGQLQTQAEKWENLLTRVRFTLPPEGRVLEDSIRANLAYILINRDGAGFQPGSRSYERSWIRDGSMTAAAMLEFGITDEVRSFIDWYAPFQFPGGKVPCVVDRRGPDPVIEHDSHGQLIYAIAEYTRYTGDLETARRHFDRVIAATEYIEGQRELRRAPAFRAGGPARQEPGKPAMPAESFFGLMPESISHEGYSAKPMHSHWDNFFTIKGLKDAAELARLLDRPDLEAKWRGQAQDLRERVIESVRIAQRVHGIDYLPGCVELGDFDATSTTVAINPCNEAPHLPREWLEATFERWWTFFERRRDDPTFEWKDYTPYEVRIPGALIMLGQRERAWQALQWYFNDQLPAAWRAWAEVLDKDRRNGRFVGDIPHTWVGSDFLRTARTMFVYEDEKLATVRGSGALVLFAGVPVEWVRSETGVGFDGLGTPYGRLSASILPAEGGAKGALVLKIGELTRVPPGGVVVALPPGVGPARDALERAGGELVPAGQLPHKGTVVRFSRLPVELRLQ
jgi:hypothetical protein